MKVLFFALFFTGVAGSCEVDALSGCKDVLQADADDGQALELLQMQSTKNAEVEEHVDVDEAIEEDEDTEESADEETDELEDAEDTEEDETVEVVEKFDMAAQIDEVEDATEDVQANASEYEAVPIGTKWQSGKICVRDRKTSCYSPRSWIGKKSKQFCNDECAKGTKGCKYFFWGNDHCSLCKKCGKTGMSDSYDIYKKYVIDFPVRDANCKERYSSQKRLKKPRGCKNRAKKLGAVAFSWKSKQCRTWNKCSTTKKAKGWVLQKTR